jgi:ferric enterobactin receptor
MNTTNFISYLTDSISGVQVTGSCNGITSFSRIRIRGDKSVNISNRGPLFKVDGIP